jgi:hypothetical protein
MKKIILLVCIALVQISGYSQSKKQLKAIIKEANLLYSYEKAAWNSSDLMMKQEHLKEKFGDYIVYHKSDTIFATYIDKSRKKRIAKYAFTTKNPNVPFQSKTEATDISKEEKMLFQIKYKIINQLSDKKYGIAIPEGFSPNLILIKEQEEYRLYMIMGTTQPDVIPFGNDYLFNINKEGEIVQWKKFHSRVIPARTKMNGNAIVSAFHTHLKRTPYITATDICTFKLYAELSNMKDFSVLSTANKKKYTYSIKTNKIKVSKI